MGFPLNFKLLFSTFALPFSSISLSICVIGIRVHPSDCGVVSRYLWSSQCESEFKLYQPKADKQFQNVACLPMSVT